MAALATTPPSKRAFGALVKTRELGIILALAALVGYTTVSNPRFLSGQSIRDILLNTAILAVMAAGQAVVVITRNIDLSVGSVLGLSAFTVATMMSANPGLPMVVALLAGLAVGAVAGVLNGVLVRYGRVPALVVTLGTLYMYRGITYSWAGGQQVNADELPRHFLRFANASVLGIPWLVLIALVVVGGVSLVMRNYRVGRELYAMGSSPQAAELAGIRVARNLLGAFTVSGALAGLAGVLFAARFGTVDAAAGTGYELNVVAAVVVGGVAVFGGSGTVWGAGLGALLLTVIGSALAVLDIDQFWQQAIVGALILLAICADRLVAVRIARSLRKRDSHV
ncbi:sugar ABC transporter permease [Actinoplanes sp. NBRC 14428]|uniref:Autoinducer 2 import system permease protein LsrC n=1 Tax=Pseudosporangium ferrugineum TaxID=439699 RepID=A0A2T0RE15_9ACTN|nr:ABC transporter permease [Pseudosporangium ferrugineum]PRY19434.1 monosaccharide ABC transporter membrane protein (CUT2 family) [Pseudosporangium ferrugineum]BCJ52570.1 sugar ABC transporter permease [Actinoplanes sp. NBRC 14428]